MIWILSIQYEAGILHDGKLAKVILATQICQSSTRNASSLQTQLMFLICNRRAAPVEGPAPNTRHGFWDVYMCKGAAITEGVPPNACHRVGDLDALQASAHCEDSVTDARHGLRDLHVFQGTA